MKKSIFVGDFKCALQFPLNSISLIFIYIYVSSIAIREGTSTNKAVTAECSCTSTDRKFYNGMFWSFTAVWILSVIICAIRYTYK